MSRISWNASKCKDYASKVKTRAELKKKYPKAYCAAQRQGILDEIFGGHKNMGFSSSYKRSGFWNREECTKAVKECKTRSEFEKRFPSAVGAAKRAGFYEDLFKNHPNNGYTTKQVKEGHWQIKENCLEAAKSCKSRSELQSKFSGAYTSFFKNNWLKDLDRILPAKGTPYTRYIYKIANEAEKLIYIGLSYDPKHRYYKHKTEGREEIRDLIKLEGTKLVIYPKLLSLKDAQKKERNLVKHYQSSKSWKVLNLAKPGSLGGNAIIHSPELIKLLANSCQTRNEMAEYYPVAYQTAVKHKKLNDLFKSHPNKGYINKAFRITFKWCKKCADQTSTRKEFKKRFPSEATTASSKGWLDNIFKNHPHKGYIQTQSGAYTYDQIHKFALKSSDRQDFLEKFRGAHSRAVEMKWLDRLFESHPNRGYRTAKGFLNLSKKECSFLASFCQSRSEFKDFYKSYYLKCVKSGWLDEIFRNHPEKGLKRARPWSEECIAQAAKKCKTRSEFKKKYPGAYRKIVGTGQMNQIFKNHPNEGYIIRSEKGVKLEQKH